MHAIKKKKKKCSSNHRLYYESAKCPPSSLPIPILLVLILVTLFLLSVSEFSCCPLERSLSLELLWICFCLYSCPSYHMFLISNPLKKTIFLLSNFFFLLNDNKHIFVGIFRRGVVSNLILLIHICWILKSIISNNALMDHLTRIILF